MQETVAKYGLKYGPAAIIAVYLVHFLVTTVSGNLEEIIDLSKHSATIHEKMLTVLEDIRDEKVATAIRTVR
jgi:hypothetical protein